MNLTQQQCAAMLTEHHPNPFIQLSNQGYFIQCGCGARPYIGDPDQVWKVWGDHVAGALLADDTPAHPDTTQRVHNHLYGGWPFCNERTVDGQLRGACLNDDGSARVAQPVPTPRVHNHPPYQPFCNERTVDGQLRGACLDDEGIDTAQPVPAPEVSRGVAEAWHRPVYQTGTELVCHCGRLISNYASTQSLAAMFAEHIRDALGGERGDGA